MKHNSTLVPPYIAVPDQVEGGIMSPIEEKMCTKSMSNPISVITDTSSSISESSGSQSNSHSSKSLISKLNLVEFEGQTNLEKKDVSKNIFTDYFKCTLVLCTLGFFYIYHYLS